MSVHGQGCRLIWFSAPSEEISAHELFKNLTGEEPDAVRRNKTPSPVNPITSAAESDIGDFKFLLNQQPGRSEFFLAPQPKTDSPKLPLLDLNSALDYLEKAIAKADSLPEAVRLSCIVNRYQEAQSSNEASSYFYTAIGADPGVPEAIDLVLQVNRRTQFAGMLSNRVVTYNTQETQSIKMVGSSVPELITEYGFGVMYDYNTVPDGRTLSLEAQKTIFLDMFGAVRTALGYDDLSFLKD